MVIWSLTRCFMDISVNKEYPSLLVFESSPFKFDLSIGLLGQRISPSGLQLPYIESIRTFSTLLIIDSMGFFL